MKNTFGFQAMDNHFCTCLCLRAVEIKHLLLVPACGKVRGRHIKSPRGNIPG